MDKWEYHKLPKNVPVHAKEVNHENLQCLPSRKIFVYVKMEYEFNLLYVINSFARPFNYREKMKRNCKKNPVVLFFSQFRTYHFRPSSDFVHRALSQKLIVYELFSRTDSCVSLSPLQS